MSVPVTVKPADDEGVDGELGEGQDGHRLAIVCPLRVLGNPDNRLGEDLGCCLERRGDHPEGGRQKRQQEHGQDDLESNERQTLHLLPASTGAGGFVQEWLLSWSVSYAS